ncbi:L-xylo-3-hexulose reductase [Claviceps maximensis]|nr:L-xylo-3-hexulose reductase [Claviceps maximensis]
MSRPYENKLAVVTGGSRGIGQAVTRRLAAKGANVVVAYVSESSTAPTKQLCAELSTTHSVRCVPVQADLSEPATAANTILAAARALFLSYHDDEKADASAGGHDSSFQIDVLINNAGLASNQLLNDEERGPITAEEFHRLYTVNVLAPLLLTQAVAPYLPRDRSGRIVTVSSVSSSIGYPGQSVYAGSKAAVEAMTRTWSRELATRATVNAVNPGPVWGDMYEQAGEKLWKINQPYVDVAPLAEYHGESAVLELVGGDAQRFDAVVREKMGGMRPALTHEIAGTIDMLCSVEGGWTTGSVVCANGGMRMSIA